MEAHLLDRVQGSIYGVLRRDGATEGTAFAVGSGGLILTCMHVLTGEVEIDEQGRFKLLHLTSRKPFFATLLKEFSRAPTKEDVAVLRIEEAGRSSSPSLANYRVETGSTVYSFGFPPYKNVEGMPARGTITGPAFENEFPVIAVSCPEISAGFSGGPAVDEETGMVIGVVVSIAGADEFGRGGEAAFLVPAATIISLCPQLPVGVHPELEQYARAVGKQLDESPYYIAGLPDFRISECFQPAELTRLEFEATNGSCRGHPTSLEEILNVVRFKPASTICVTGDAGSGKSGLLRYMGLQLLHDVGTQNLVLPVYLNAKTFASSTGLDLNLRHRPEDFR
jgi:Trypsin-like peptidase domain